MSLRQMVAPNYNNFLDKNLSTCSYQILQIKYYFNKICKQIKESIYILEFLSLFPYVCLFLKKKKKKEREEKKKKKKKKEVNSKPRP